MAATATPSNPNPQTAASVSVPVTLSMLIIIGFIAWLVHRIRPPIPIAELRVQQTREERDRSRRKKQFILDRIPIVRYTTEYAVRDPDIKIKETVREEEVGCGDSTICSVCMETFKGNENVRVLLCGHMYHQRCIDPWLLMFASSSSCPLCRRTLDDGSQSKGYILGIRAPERAHLRGQGEESRYGWRNGMIKVLWNGTRRAGRR